MENYVRYFIKILVIMILIALMGLFIVLVKDNTNVKATKNLKKNIDITDDDENKDKSTNNINLTNNNAKTDVNSKNQTTNYNSSNQQVSNDKATSNDNEQNTNNESKETEKKIETANKSEDIDFSLNFSNKVLEVGKTAQIVVNSNINNLNIKYKSFKTDVATVSESGTIKALKKGTTYIEVNVNQRISKVIELVVIDNNKPTSSSINKNNKVATSSSTNKNNKVASSSTNKNNKVTSSSTDKNNKVTTNSSTDKNNKVTTNSSTDKNNKTTSSSTDKNNKVTTSSSTNKNNKVTSSSTNKNNKVTSSSTNKNNKVTSSSTNKNNKVTSSSTDNNNNISTNKTKNGWYTINGKKYYYKNNTKLTNRFVNYIYLDNKGVAQDKIGNFSATLYGAIAWTNRNVNIRREPIENSKLLGTIPTGAKLTILSSDNPTTKYIKISYNGIIGYVYSDFLLINLPDVIPDIVYYITNADKSLYKAANTSIADVTGKNLYGFSKKYNAKIGKNTYYVPLLYPVAKQLQVAYNIAKKDGYNLKIYDTYRPNDVTKYVNSKFRSLYNSNNNVKKLVDYDKNGSYWGPGWFLANNVSTHNKGIALDLTLTDKNNNELKAQTTMHMLDTRSTVKYNNSTANKLRSIMTSQGFETLESEWWHFQENNYSSSPINTFHLK